MKFSIAFVFLFCVLMVFLSCHTQEVQTYDTIIRNGTIYDGSNSQPFNADIAINADTIAFIGDLSSAKAKKEIDATGLAVAPGFINMLSWADRSLLMDGRSMSDIKQGVTLEIFGEGWSPGPVKRTLAKPVDSLWTTLDGYLRWLTKKGVSPNVASFVGHTAVRNYVMGYENRKATADELEEMKQLVREAMQEGALGLGTSLIYAPATYAPTEELIELAKVAAEYKCIYITHMRSESDFILDALNETFRIAKEANIPAEIYHLKINHERNWTKIDTVLFKIDSAQKAGLKITANMYPYAASNTSLVARLPTWVQEGGAKEMRKKLKNPATRQRVLEEMRLGIPSKNSDPKDVMILGFKLDSLNKLYRGKRLDEVASLHGKDADETLIDLLLVDKNPGAAVYFLISEANMQRMLRLPFVTFGSDGASISTTKTFADFGMVHPRTYGTFAHVLGTYVREQKLFSLEDAVHRMTQLPASRVNIKKRGSLKVGYFADVVVFNPATIQDHATYEDPHQYSSGVLHVFVNGQAVLENGEHTGAMPGRIIRNDRR
jgi:N-acyl-D-amino-acid deacylase